MLKVVQTINSYLSDYILVFLLLAMGIWYTVKTRFVQVRCFKEGLQKTFGELTLRGEKKDNGMSSFQALATASLESHMVPSTSKIILSIILFIFDSFLVYS